MKELYTSIQKLFRDNETVAIFREAGLTPPEYIDLYNGQRKCRKILNSQHLPYSLIIP